MKLERAARALAVVAIVLFCWKTAQVLGDGARELSTDFVTYFRGAQRLAAGLPLYRRDLDLVHVAEYIYPPALAIVLWPLRDYATAWWLWAAFSLACGAASVWLIVRECGADLWTKNAGENGAADQYSGVRGAVLLAALLIFPPLSIHLMWGQVQLPILLMLTLAWWQLRRGRASAVGLWLGITIAIKLYPLALLLPLCAMPISPARKTRAIGATVLTALGVTLASFALVGWSEAVFYIERVLPDVSRTQIHERVDNASASALLRWTLPAVAAPLVTLLFQCTVAGLTLWRARQISAGDGWALGITAMVLLTPVIWPHYFLLLLLPWLNTLAQFHRAGRDRDVAWLGVVYFLVATAGVVYYMPSRSMALLAQTLPVCGTLLLFGLQLSAHDETSARQSTL